MRTPFVLLSTSLAAATEGDLLPLADGRDHHVRTVLRRAAGDELEVTDGHGYVAAAVLAEDTGCRLVAPPRAVSPPSPAIVVHHALAKGKGMDEAVRTLAELGVAAVRPVVTARTVVRPDAEKSRSVGDRLRAVAASACEQARSAHLCAVEDPAPWRITESYTSGPTLCLVAHPDADTGLDEVARPGLADSAYAAVELAVGPEGGFTDDEVTAAVDAGWTAVRAGHTVLRTVHAGTVLTAALLAFSGRLG